MEQEAEKRVKYRFMLAAIDEKDDLKFTKEEFQNRASEIAASYCVDKAELLKAYGSMDVIEYDMKMHKALEILKEKGKVNVHNLSEYFSVTPKTIRRDLEFLEENGE